MDVEEVPEAEGAGKREAKRARVLLAAKIRTAMGEIPVRLRDLSRKGALIECENPPPVDSELVFSRGDTIVPARVAWRAGGKAGLEFLHPIEESEVLVHVTRPTPVVRPEVDPRFKRPGILAHGLSAHERKLAQVWGVQVGITVGDD